ncbi:MAG: MFS transporter [Clostridia bacterium]|nr:MFS transporter [Clostridia bacterium]
MKLSLKQKIAFGIGAVGKDMVYALSASYVMFYYNDTLKLSATFVGLILMIARVFDALNDPFMGVLVAKTKSRWGRFRPWLFSGTVLNALVLYALFAAPQGMIDAQKAAVEAGGNHLALMVYFSIVYILWGVTYTMMDIPYWSMIPAVTDTPADRENLSVVGRTCAGVGSALIAMFTMLAVGMLGNGSDVVGFRYVALGVAVIFVITEIICCFFMREHQTDMRVSSVKEMFRALFGNDQALIVVATIVLINMALYLTSNFIIYFFKYDFGGEGWKGTYTLFSTVGGAFQILGMMIVYPVLRKKQMTNEKIFILSISLAIGAYLLLLVLCLLGITHNLILLCIPGAIVFACNGMLSVLTTVFLSGSVDYGELQTGRREESVIFSMQTFVVKAASGVAVFLTGIGLDLIGLVGNTDEEAVIAQQSASTLTGLRLLMTVLPILGLLLAMLFFKRKFRLTDAYANEISEQLKAKRS